MSQFRVHWTIDVEADDPQGAAQEAFCAMQDAETLATCFTVTDPDGKRFSVELKFEDQRCRVEDLDTGKVEFFRL